MGSQSGRAGQGHGGRTTRYGRRMGRPHGHGDAHRWTATGSTGTFARKFEDVALVRRLEVNEGKREIPPIPAAEEPQHERAAH